MTVPRIRQATLADAAELARLRWDFSPDAVAPSGQPFAEFLCAALAGAGLVVWAAECDD
jgi:hypothetical protein